jgi:hypothetical protein
MNNNCRIFLQNSILIIIMIEIENVVEIVDLIHESLNFLLCFFRCSVNDDQIRFVRQCNNSFSSFHSDNNSLFERKKINRIRHTLKSNFRLWMIKRNKHTKLKEFVINKRNILTIIEIRFYCHCRTTIIFFLFDRFQLHRSLNDDLLFRQKSL